MENNFTRMGFEKIFNIENLITIFYMEFSKDFEYAGESHDFWEMVYIDKGEMICTADKNRFVLKSGELTFHKPNEFHNLSGNKSIAPNVSIITFETKSREMKYFEGKIFKLNSEEKALLSMLFSEGLSAFRLVDEKNPLLQNIEKIEDAPIGSSQITKNLLEIFLIKLRRNKEMLTKKKRRSYKINGVEIPYELKAMLDYLEENLEKKISIASIAEHFGKSESTVKNLFSTYQDGGIIKYFNSLKINEAKKLIREGNFNMSQIADKLGFDNPQYFSKFFRTYTGMTPSEYKTSII
ncbi:MAG: AraC family transcriptional regulator [Clostridia bacterium]|nr:AraC family transcriptional regulator [Clostridia bacterium]